MNELNILILSAGRRVELIQCFQRAARKLGVISNIVAADCSDTAPALYFSDQKYILPRINDPNYIESIIDICTNERIALIVPTIDTELLLLTKNKEAIESRTQSKVLISHEEVIKICRDKVNTHIFMEEHGFGVPRMFTEDDIQRGDIQYPAFIKPRTGSSSIHAYRVHNRDELNLYRKLIHDPIIQEFVEGEEYTVDVFLDFNSSVLTVVPRLRMATRSGEISKGKIMKDRQIIRDVKKLMNVLRPIGHITVQLMKSDKGIVYIEINPRFGGGAPMSIQSGADSCENLYRLLMGHKLEYNENYQDNLTFLRYDSSICLDEHMEIIP